MFSSLQDAINQSAAAALVLQNAYAYAATNDAPDLTLSHMHATKAGELAEVALGLPTGTFSNPAGGTNKPSL